MAGVASLNLPLNTDGQFVTAGNGFDGDVLFRHAGGEELLLCAGDESLDDLLIPSCVDDCDAEAGS
jgi:hypothetical protein